MKAEIISVGTELLLGDIVDTNAAFLSRELAALGIGCYRRTTVGDNLERMTSTFKSALQTADIVIATGGLGPTVDDITKDAAASALGVPLVMDNGLLADIKAFFGKLNAPMTENNLRQAYKPLGAIGLHNKNGTAPGIYIEHGGKTVALLPGPPAECEPMFFEQLKPLLEKKQDACIISKTVRMIGIGESTMETYVKDMLDGANPSVAPYGGNMQVWLRITARAINEGEAQKLIQPVCTELYSRLGNFIYGEDDDTIEAVTVNLLRKNGLKLATAESCTGGMLASRITSIPGASDVFTECAVTYSNEAKMTRLGVSKLILAEHGAVSSETAAKMAEGIAKTSGSDIGISITGVAGPGGGTDEKPVGLVYIGLHYKGKTETFKLNWSGERERIRARAVTKAFEILWKLLSAL